MNVGDAVEWNTHCAFDDAVTGKEYGTIVSNSNDWIVIRNDKMVAETGYLNPFRICRSWEVAKA